MASNINNEKRKKTRILFVAMSESVHTARWISQLSDANFDIHLFPSQDCGMTHPDMHNVTVYHSFYHRTLNNNNRIKNKGIPLISEDLAMLGRFGLRKKIKDYRVKQLIRVIKRIKPDLIHSLEIQHAGYITLEAKKKLPPEQFPPWLVTNWGSDIYLFGRLAEHEPKIREVLSNCNYYSCECNRDVALAREYGFTGKILDVMPNTGGFKLDEVIRLRSPGPTSKRKKIVIKGYQSEFGRALVGLRALDLCGDILNDYEIYIHSVYDSTHPTIGIAAELLAKKLKIPIKIVPDGTSHKEILKLHGNARISIGLSISDAISTSMLEALLMGSFPIQSFTSCANEWITDGKTGYLVHPEDPEQIAKAIRSALTDDVLVDDASKSNWNIAVSRLNKEKLKKQALKNYKTILSNKTKRKVD